MPSDALQRVQEYAKRWRKSIEDFLGRGYDGVVASLENGTAAKSHYYDRLYCRERDVYRRLGEHRVEDVCGFSVPRLVDCDDELMVIEMEVVTKPYVLDFAGAYLDSRGIWAEWTEEDYEEWEAEKRELFEDRWPVVQSVLSTFRSFGVYLSDIHPGNIAFEDDAD